MKDFEKQWEEYKHMVDGVLNPAIYKGVARDFFKKSEYVFEAEWKVYCDNVIAGAPNLHLLEGVAREFFNMANPGKKKPKTLDDVIPNQGFMMEGQDDALPDDIEPPKGYNFWGWNGKSGW